MYQVREACSAVGVRKGKRGLTTMAAAIPHSPFTFYFNKSNFKLPAASDSRRSVTVAEGPFPPPSHSMDTTAAIGSVHLLMRIQPKR